MASESAEDQKLKHQLLIGLKTTVEGLLATNSTDVWSTYGGLSRLCKDVEKILNHRLKFVVGDTGSAVDFWPFVKGLKWLNPVMTPFIEKIRKGPHQKGVSKGQVWVRESLRDHKLVNQLKTLVANEQHLHRHYFEDAFLFNRRYFTALCTCLQAVEENRVSLLADIDPKLLYFNPSMLKASPSHIRSVSLPVNAFDSSRPPRRRSHKSFSSAIMSLAPPFSSPQSQESLLTTSDELAFPHNLGSSTSPDDSRMTASEALRNVLRKSGSDSPPGLSPPDVTKGGFSFYTSINSDPLLNLDLLKLSESPNDSQENLKLEKAENKKELTRSVSESVVTKKTLDRKTSDQVDKIILEDDDNSAFSGKSLTLTKSMTLTQDGKVNRGSQMIFSDTESTDTGTKTQKSPERKGKLTHKRSRSDTIGVKMSLSELKSDTKSSSNTTKTMGTSTSVADQPDSSAVTVLSTTILCGNSGYFPQPQKGQSLLNYLSSHDFHTCANLEKENAHFSISEALIAAIEQMKWNHIISPADRRTEEQDEEESDEEIKQLQQRIRIRKRERLKEKARGFPAFSDGRTDTTTSRSQSVSPFSSTHDSEYSDSNSSSEIEEDQIELTMDDKQGSLSTLKNSGLSLSLASLYSDADIQKFPISRESSTQIPLSRENSTMESGAFLSAESVAISLLKKFSEKQLPKASDLQWLVTEQDAPQRLLPLPDSYPISPDDADRMKQSAKSSRTRLRGNMEWAPPRPQIIFSIQPTPNRSVLLAKQNYRCAGCGMRVEKGYAKRYRYCAYTGKYFCQCCHSNQQAVIPAKMLKKWDFSKDYVSNFARDFLTKIVDEPLFNISDVNPMLYKKVKLLDNVKDWRIQLERLRSLIQLCKHTKSLSEEISKLPSHWVQDVHLYSISDLYSVRHEGAYGGICNRLKNLATAAISHVESCQFCQNFGYICEMCRNQNDIIFPYQLDKVAVCEGCKSCYHKECFVPQKCPKCARLEARKKRQSEESLDQTEENEENEEG